jgi:hypothetical protein
MKDFSLALLAKLEKNGRDYATKHGNPFDWAEQTDNPPRKAWERNTGIRPEAGMGRHGRELQVRKA